MKTLFLIGFLLAANMVSAQSRSYTHDDSSRARAYFDASWKYGIGSLKHQAYLDSALMIMPTRAYYWQQKAMPLYKAEKFDLARPFIDSAVKYAPLQWLDYRAFMKCIFEKRYRDALNDFYIVRNMPGNSAIVMDHPYNFYIGLCHLQLNNFDSSLYYFEACVAADRKTLGDKWVHYNRLFYLGIAWYVKEDYGTANEVFAEAIKQYPNFSDAQYYKAYCMYKLGKKQEAETLMELAYNNFTQGYSMPEDNAFYENYPYQVKKHEFTNSLEWMKKEVAKNN